MDATSMDISLLDLLDIDEDSIDKRLTQIMSRTYCEANHLSNAIHLLKYKQLLYEKDKEDCENEEEYNFVCKLISQVHTENVIEVCRITQLVLELDKRSLKTKSQHLLHQVLSDIIDTSDDTFTEPDSSNRILLSLKLCDTILDVLIKNKISVPLHCMHTPVEKVLNFENNSIVKYFLLNTVPKMFTIVTGTTILDDVWNYIIKTKNDKRLQTLEYLTILGDLYFPPKINRQHKSTVVEEDFFWELIFLGLHAPEIEYRKFSLYLVKRAIEYFSENEADFNGEPSVHLVGWRRNKEYFDDFITLFESLQETQSHIVLPSLCLFQHLNGMDMDWLNSLFVNGLKHESAAVKLKCIEERLKYDVSDASEAKMLLDAMNNINLFPCPVQANQLMAKFHESLLINKNSFLNIWLCIPKLTWSAVPLFYIFDILQSTIIENDKVVNQNQIQFYQALNDITNVPCNVPKIKENIKSSLSEIVGKLCGGNNWRDLKYVKNVEVIINDIDANMQINDDDIPEFIDILMLYKSYLCLVRFIESSCEFYNVWKAKLEDILKSLEFVNCENNKDITEYLDMLAKYCVLAKILFGNSSDWQKKIKDIFSPFIHTILKYYNCIVQGDQYLNVTNLERCITVFDIVNRIFGFPNQKDEKIEDLYTKCLTIALGLKNEDFQRKVLSLHIISTSHLFHAYENKDFSNILKSSRLNKIKDDVYCSEENSNRRLYSYCYEIVFNSYYLLRILSNMNHSHATQFLLEALDCSSPDNLWILLNIFEKVIVKTKSNESENLLTQIWKAVENTKSHTEYSKNVHIFMLILFQKDLLNKLENEVILKYFMKMIEINDDSIRSSLYRAVSIVKLDQNVLSPIIHELFMNVTLHQKERIMTHILNSNNPFWLRSPWHCLIYEIEYKIQILLNANNDVLQQQFSLATTKINGTFKNKVRYHEGSQAHKELYKGITLLLNIGVIDNSTINKTSLKWCVDMLNKLPHQPDVRLCLEWYIALYICVKGLVLNVGTMQITTLDTVPTTSKFMILYHVIKHRILTGKCGSNEYDFVMNILLCNTMGAMFNTRLLAQYLALKIFELKPCDKYKYAITLVENALASCENEKSYIKLRDDYFVNEFELVRDFNYLFIVLTLPSNFSADFQVDEIAWNSTEMKYERLYEKILYRVSQKKQTTNVFFNQFLNTWLRLQPKEPPKIKQLKKVNLKESDNEKITNGVIQKKYIPWKNMQLSDNSHRIKDSQGSELIVVASLVDKLPNLGGMARTGEVFAVKKLVIDSIRHVENQQFKGLSMSAENWIDIEEIRPGKPLKDYLMKKKEEGYSIVAAEQTSKSVQLQHFSFPKKCLLVLGHEKQGMPCDLLPYMDHCVEIPQQGFVRSLNVHVTAAIFIWEYSRQNMLRNESRGSVIGVKD